MKHLPSTAGLLVGLVLSGCAAVSHPPSDTAHTAYNLYAPDSMEQAGAASDQPAAVMSRTSPRETALPAPVIADHRLDPAPFTRNWQSAQAGSADKPSEVPPELKSAVASSLGISSQEDETGPIELMVTAAPGVETALVEEESSEIAAQTTLDIEPDAGLLLDSDEIPDLWDRIRAGYGLPDIGHERAATHLDWYIEHPAYLGRVVERARPYLYDIVKAVEKRGFPQEIALLPVVESAFQPFAYSPGRAAGIWQFIPGTGKLYGLKQNWWYDGRRDIHAATQSALDYLSYLKDTFNGDWLLALAAYNSGSGTVSKAIRKNQAKGRPTDFWSLDLPLETREYVPRLLAVAELVADPESFGISLGSIPDESFLERIAIGSQLDLALAAELAELSLREIYDLNPGFNRWATDPDGPHYLMIPKDKAELFKTNLAQLPKDKRVKWERHLIRSGETLGAIAQRYNTSVAVLQQVNGVHGKWIRAGDSLIIPVATRSLDAYILSADQRRKAIQNTPREGAKVQHIVRSGDTLWDISVKHKVSVASLAAWNGIAPSDPLKPGQRLVIWSHTQGVKVIPTKLASLPEHAVQQRVQYRVRKGDSLARISQKFNVTVEQLRSWNTLPKNKYIQPGQTLTVYVDITRQAENI